MLLQRAKVCFVFKNRTQNLTNEEQKIKQKCNELKRRIQEVEECNEISLLALSRTRASIRRYRLQYSVLLERLHDRALAQGHQEGNRPWLPVLFEENSQVVDHASAPITHLHGVAKDEKVFKSPFQAFDSAETKTVSHIAESSKQEAHSILRDTLSTEEQAHFTAKPTDTPEINHVTHAAPARDTDVPILQKNISVAHDDL